MAITNNRFKIRNIRGIVANKLRRIKLHKLITAVIILASITWCGINYKAWSRISMDIVGTLVLNIKQFYSLPTKYIAAACNTLNSTKSELIRNLEPLANSEKVKALEEKIISLELENVYLKQSLKFAEHLGDHYITTRLLSTSVTPYGHLGIINAGSRDGVCKDQVVAAGNTVVGRVLEVSELFAQVVFPTDFRMKISVIASRTQQRCIVSGNNALALKIKCELGNEDLQLGDILTTAGDSQYYPPGLLVAQISKTGVDAEASMIADLSSINIVNVISYQGSLFPVKK